MNPDSWKKFYISILEAKMFFLIWDMGVGVGRVAGGGGV
jgi:hypothetical protein